jgi:hypothetical protein
MTYKFDPATDVTDLSGKVAIVTGGKWVEPAPELAYKLTVSSALASVWRP